MLTLTPQRCNADIVRHPAPTPSPAADVPSLPRCSYVLAHERDASGRPDKGGHYPTQMDVGFSPTSGGEPDTGTRPMLVHWCHGAPGVVSLLVKAHEVS